MPVYEPLIPSSPVCTHPFLPFPHMQGSNGCNQKIRLIFYILTKSALSILWDFTAPLLTPPPFTLPQLSSPCWWLTYESASEGNIANVICLLGLQLTWQKRALQCARLSTTIWARRSNSTFLLHSSRHSTGWAIKKPSSSRCWPAILQNTLY